MAVKGVPSSSCRRITFRATSFPFTLAVTHRTNKQFGGFFMTKKMRNESILKESVEPENTEDC